MRRVLLPLIAAFALTGVSIATAHASLEAVKAVQQSGGLAAGQVPYSRAKPAPTIVAENGGSHEQTAHDAAVAAGDLKISDAWARAMLPAQPTGGAYLTITNGGKAADRLLGVSSPVASKVEIHMMKMDDHVMVMRPVQGGLEIPAGETVELKPGGYHMMFMGVKEAFKGGTTVPVTLEFEHAGKVELSLPVKSASGGQDHSSH